MYRAFKNHRIMWLGLAAALPLQALASPPSNAAIGQMEAILTFCANSNPALASRAQLTMQMLGGTTAAGARTTVAYQNAFKSASAQLAKLTPAEAAARCAVLAK
jgi:hypothetical protein